jgi:hypothetical protein
VGRAMWAALEEMIVFVEEEFDVRYKKIVC